MSMSDLSHWTGAPRPSRTVLEGRYARLEPLNPARHGPGLLASALEPGAEARFRYLFEQPPAGMGDLAPWLDKAAVSQDPLFFAVIDRATGLTQGRQALMRIDPTNGVIEVGNILWGPTIARTRTATEALYLFARHVFDDLGYRRFEWKCNSLNAPSRRAALRFGFSFEGIFRQHMVVKGQNRDTAWYAMLDEEWPGLKARFESWLEPDNFDADGRQKRKLNIVA